MPRRKSVPKRKQSGQTASSTGEPAPSSAAPAASPEPDFYHRSIGTHGGAKYLRTIRPADGVGSPIKIDVYCVIKAFGITCPALQHALKKILAAGQRGKGDKVSDIKGILDATWRALELEEEGE